MCDPLTHSLSSAKKFGGSALDYIHIHQWFDETKHWLPTFWHRAFRHHTMGIHECVQKYGPAIARASDGILVSTRLICEQHLKEDHGCLPTPKDWVDAMSGDEVPPWVNRQVNCEV